MTAHRGKINNRCAHVCIACECFGWVRKSSVSQRNEVYERLYTCTHPMSDHYCHVFQFGHRICGYCVRKDGKDKSDATSD